MLRMLATVLVATAMGLGSPALANQDKSQSTYCDENPGTCLLGGLLGAAALGAIFGGGDSDDRSQYSKSACFSRCRGTAPNTNAYCERQCSCSLSIWAAPENSCH